MEQQFHPDPARKLSGNAYDVYHRCVYSEKLPMMDRGTVRNMQKFHSKNKFEKLVHLVGFIIRNSEVSQVCVGEDLSDAFYVPSGLK